MAIVELKPPEELKRRPTDAYIFEAGPIQGAPDWQDQARQIILSQHQGDSEFDLFIANPRRDVPEEDFDYTEQVSWEIKHLRKAAQYGAVIFWLAKQDLNLPYRAGRSYAQTTRFEFGNVLGWKYFVPEINISIGIEPGYKGNEKYYLHRANDFEIPVYDNLEELCVDALYKVSKSERHEF